MMDDVSREGGAEGTGAEAARTSRQGTACKKAQREVQGAGCRVQGSGHWPGPVGKELQCVNQRLAGEDPLCDATMRAVRDGLVWSLVVWVDVTKQNRGR